jgi:hypothetical protein
MLCNHILSCHHRLQQDVSLLELQPTVEDVFHAETTNVDEYLQQIQDMTIIAAIQVRAEEENMQLGVKPAARECQHKRMVLDLQDG